jgi:hypothetical protein
MATTVIEKDVFASRLETALKQGLEKADIKATVEIQRVPGTSLHRGLVVSKQFKRMGHLERQDLIWRILDQAFTPDEQLRISSIRALTLQETGG